MEFVNNKAVIGQQQPHPIDFLEPGAFGMFQNVEENVQEYLVMLGPYSSELWPS